MIKDWKIMFLDEMSSNTDGDSLQFKYKEPRQCLQADCQFEGEDPADMFKHIRMIHVKTS